MKWLTILVVSLFLLGSALSGHAYQVSGTITGYSATGLKYIYMIPFSLDDFYIGIASIFTDEYTINNVEENSYIIFAYQDVNLNLLPGLDEPRGFYGGQPAVPLELHSDTTGIDIELHPPYTGGFSGTISFAGPDSGITYIGAYDNPDFEGDLLGFGLMLKLDGNGNYTALADSGTYYAHCFMDVNFNFNIDPDEPYGVYGGIETPQPFLVSQTNWPEDIDMEMFVGGVEVPEGDERPDLIPDKFALLQNYPNPFNSETQIDYQLPVDAHVSLIVYNVPGQKIVTLVDAEQWAGSYTVSWAGQDDKDHDVATGLYFCRLQAGDYAEARKMILLR